MIPQIIDGEFLPEEFRAIQRFLRQTSLIKAEERPNYVLFKQLAGALEIYVSRGEGPSHANIFDRASYLRMDGKSLMMDC